MASLKSSRKPFFHKKGPTIEKVLARILKDTKNNPWNWWHLPASAPFSSLWLCDNSITTGTSTVGRSLAVTKEAGRPGKPSKVHFQRAVYRPCTLSP